MEKKKEFKFSLLARVRIVESGEVGNVIGCAQYATSEDAYLVRYKAGDQRAVESWWQESALVAE